MKTTKSFSELLTFFDVPTPRYTSYPTVPYWNTADFNLKQWKNEVINAFKYNNGEISLYLHLPFCEALCTYCGCNKRITKNHAVETPYIESLLKEFKLYLALFEGKKPILNQLHLGGGTPSFFSAENLQYLLNSIIEKVDLAIDYEFSIEVHPNYTNKKQLQVLADLGFRRLSVGVQDFDPKVQFIINRIQTFEQTIQVIEEAKEVGFKAINVDIIYGLPLQTLESIQLTIDYVKKLNPDRIAFYSYAHVPWKSAGQRRYAENDLPSGKEKRSLYELGREQLLAQNYFEIGMDHFAKFDDELFIAEKNGHLHRNFMGYTTSSTKLLIGLGASSISDTWTGFMQNEKEIEAYQLKIENNEFPISKGHLLTDEDSIIRHYILELMCKHTTHLKLSNIEYNEEVFSRLSESERLGLVEINNNYITVTESGKPFIRNIALCFDQRYWANIPKENLFSKSV